MNESEHDEQLDQQSQQNRALKNYQYVRQILQSYDETKNPSEIISLLQTIVNVKARQSRNESQSEAQEVTVKSLNQTQSRRFFITKKPTTAGLSYAETLERDNAILKQRIVQASQSRDGDHNKLQFDIRRLTVKVKELEEENKKLKDDYLKNLAELKIMREQKAEEEKMKWHREALSDKNPYLMEEFRKRQDEKDKEIRRLSKNLKKFTIMEKKLLVKEKAFEVERSEYLDRILYLSGRLGKTKFESQQ
ncbi:hypothetical protein pb186bvf_008698 [Paramecium bursaria]